MRLCSIASGSSGNCIYVGSEATHLLIDTGISGKRVEEGLKSLELTGRDVDGILITHEHSDHISGLGVISRKFEIPIYGTKGTLEAIAGIKNGPDPSLFREIKEDNRFTIKDMTVYPMRISHDAAQPVAYKLGFGDKRIAICTDIGVFNEYTVECLKGMDALLLEANHDVNMLQVGPYPYYLKQRILGDRGHLSNENAGRLLNRILTDKTKTIMLGHLSKENNHPQLAYEAVRMEITMGACPFTAEDFNIMVASRNEPSKIIEV